MMKGLLSVSKKSESSSWWSLPSAQWITEQHHGGFAGGAVCRIVFAACQKCSKSLKLECVCVCMCVYIEGRMTLLFGSSLLFNSWHTHTLNFCLTDPFLDGIATDDSTYCDRCSSSVCLPVTLVPPAKAVGWNEMPPGWDSCGPK